MAGTRSPSQIRPDEERPVTLGSTLAQTTHIQISDDPQNRQEDPALVREDPGLYLTREQLSMATHRQRAQLFMHIWINQEQNFSSTEMRSAEEAWGKLPEALRAIEDEVGEASVSVKPVQVTTI